MPIESIAIIKPLKMKRLIQSFFNSFGFEIKRKRQAKPKGSDMALGFRRFSALNLPVASVIDVGAAAGTWSVGASRFWPAASYLLLEPLAERKEILDSLVSTRSNFMYMPFAAGNEKTTINFMVADDLDGSGIAPSTIDPSSLRSVQVIRLDDAVKEKGLKGPFLVKLDTHGFEVPILEGCNGILNEVSLFIIECYGFQIVDNSLQFWEMCRYMDGLGFRLFDIVDIMHRPKDEAFWQCDAFFISKTNPLFNYNRYK
jgi:FkbM family methyltransferase